MDKRGGHLGIPSALKTSFGNSTRRSAAGKSTRFKGVEEDDFLIEDDNDDDDNEQLMRRMEQERKAQTKMSRGIFSA